MNIHRKPWKLTLPRILSFVKLRGSWLFEIFFSSIWWYKYSSLTIFPRHPQFHFKQKINVLINDNVIVVNGLFIDPEFWSMTLHLFLYLVIFFGWKSIKVKLDVKLSCKYDFIDWDTYSFLHLYQAGILDKQYIYIYKLKYSKKQC